MSACWQRPLLGRSFRFMNRRHMTARIVPLASEEAGDSRMGGTVDARVAAVAALTREGWRLSGRELPSYTRATMPVVVRSLRSNAATE